ncbi:MAG: helix-turn-helix domain-containing protein [Lachnospiraceae bacterium]
MYSVFEQLLQKFGVTAYKVSKETGVTQASLSTWKSGKSTPSSETLQKIANYFGVTIDYLMTGEEAENKKPAITPKDERDIAKKLDKIMKEIDSNNDSPLYYNGEEIDDLSKSLLRDAIESAMRQMKIINKEKYNPNKHKK